jgi:hypothetical protein
MAGNCDEYVMCRLGAWPGTFVAIVEGAPRVGLCVGESPELWV